MTKEREFAEVAGEVEESDPLLVHIRSALDLARRNDHKILVYLLEMACQEALERVGDDA